MKNSKKSFRLLCSVKRSSAYYKKQKNKKHCCIYVFLNTHRFVISFAILCIFVSSVQPKPRSKHRYRRNIIKLLGGKNRYISRKKKTSSFCREATHIHNGVHQRQTQFNQKQHTLPRHTRDCIDCAHFRPKSRTPPRPKQYKQED